MLPPRTPTLSRPLTFPRLASAVLFPVPLFRLVLPSLPMPEAAVGVGPALDGDGAGAGGGETDGRFGDAEEEQVVCVAVR